MIASGDKILIRFKKRWQLMLWIEILLYALGPAILMYFLFFNLIFSIATLISVALLIIIFVKPWKPGLKMVSSYIDQHLDVAEYSTGLLLLPKEQLSDLAKLQQYRITKELVEKLKTIKPPNHLFRACIVMSLCTLVGFIGYRYHILDHLQWPQHKEVHPDTIIFNPIDSTTTTQQPKLKSQLLTIQYPSYTRKSSIETSKMEIKAVEGSRLSWQITFDKEVKSVSMESMGNSYPMKLTDNGYVRTSILNTSGFYNFKFTDILGTSYTSELYSIEVIKDKRPDIKITDLKQFTSFSYDEDKRIVFTTSVTDDFGIAEAYIIATVSKGSGESVKFREEKLSFDSKFSRGNKNLSLSKNIDLDQMNMEPGDELYFYIEALDLKQPRPNISRSETFFAVIKDTISDEFAVEGTMGVDLMPDYFRSQRQLIIDTEKLIKDKSKLSEKDFKFKSNELGFDQKVLRLKYGEFMGDESEFGPATQENTAIPEEEDEHDDEDHEKEKDPLAAYTHDHDHENEHNLVPHEEEEDDDEKANDPLHEYLHNHDDPEESTLFTQSLKSKLRQALNEMWDAELYLRLYTPEKSLPYQYKALKLIQEIKNSARVYVHRIGFDPPPIKEDKRLTGKIDEVSNFRKKEELQLPELYPSIYKTVLRLEQLISNKTILTDKDRLLFKQAGNELAVKAIESPGKYLKTLQQLKQITENRAISPSILIEVQRGLFYALPELQPNPFKKKVLIGEINELLLKELQIHD
ncbi:tryptophan-rich sensory protein [Aquimarina sp. AU58]|uniref:tryptophan-rich sensory protein n=1 Tax=Aquimarina sp. AU58 TaxID=1874112 RepID=UPI000D6467AD|nr:tryptophan-rich sensory protein [Aquimarina sp. AU58]